MQLFGKDAGTMIGVLEKGPAAFGSLLGEMRRFDQSRDARAEGLYSTPGALRELRISQARAATARGRTLTRAEMTL